VYKFYIASMTPPFIPFFHSLLHILALQLLLF